MTGLSQDLRAALRMLARRPGFTAASILTLALGIGGATTMYGFLQAVVRQSRPTVPEPERVARIFTTTSPRDDTRGLATFGDYRRWREAARTFESLAAHTSQTLPLATSEGTEDVGATWVTPSYLSVLEATPVAGRLFTEEESRARDGRLALLSERAWRSRFGGSPSTLGGPLELDGKDYTVVGVIPERLGLVASPVDLYLPLTDREDGESVMVIGRRPRDVSWAQVRAEMDALGVEGDRARPHVRVLPILDDAGYRTRMLWILAVGPALLMLLIGCGNLAMLLLVRAVRREREMAVRVVLGASRRRLAAQLLVESWALAAAACVVGLVLAWLGLLGVRALLPPTAGDIHVALDGGTLLFAGFVTLLTPLVFGVAPLLHGLRVDVNESLSGGQHRPLFGMGQYHLRDVFVILELAFSVGLVVFVLMFLSLFNRMSSLDLSFEGEGLVVARVEVEEGTELEPGGVTVSERLREAVTAVPGVVRVTVGDLPFEGTLVRVGRSATGGGVPAHQIRAGPDYFGTLRLPLALGRGFEAGDTGVSGTAVIVNEGLATRLWPGANPLGQALHVSGQDRSEALSVVGVSRDAVRLDRLSGLDVSDLKFRYSLYRPWGHGGRPALDVIARVEGASAYSAESFRDAVRSVDRRLRLDTVFDMGSALDLTRGRSPGPMYMPAAFGGLALLLAVIGVFGVMSQLVAERRVELGVRLALGASPGAVACLVVRDGLIRVGLGVGLGLAGLAASVRVGFAGLLEATVPDPLLWAGVVSVVTLAAAAACYLPARRAARLDPMVALRSE